ncbi:recombination protein NinB [Pseudomonas protegens]|uniref:recombination protein NinB n=1 Tax=Pseudomonas protegens TaxID=380021 RepID=UPI001B301E90|nr:recombination protein NinB [Pseudomonas protegens]MBP5100380.1 recombination protein NinB [Pseudomonas protegens]QTU06132.1 recombination protein NinB [Pseudomonas protegens]QTU12442.1 recombination protein NinB [Pseudomonas protegens]QTU40180.1 recombination protein NinB [Pseudomonas protegens]
MTNIIQKPRHFWSSGPSRIRDVFKLAYLFAFDLSAIGAVEIIVRPVKSRRTLDQNAKLWAMLGDISRQVEWPVNGIMQKLDSEDWKALMTAAARQEIRMAQGINGGVVMLGESTKRMTVAELGDVIECMYVFGAEKGVIWSEPKGQMPEQWEQAA